MILHIRKKPQGISKIPFLQEDTPRIVSTGWPITSLVPRATNALWPTARCKWTATFAELAASRPGDGWLWAGQLMKRAGLTWSNYNDFTRPGPPKGS